MNEIKRMCRFCKWYRPDARYKGVIGWCGIKDEPKAVKDTCISWEHGKQMWLQGIEVEE